ncbi:ComEC/Rec2 family competence protein [Carboxylicivirga caseinilyticus]|uniref:ComEC/Rec2 family competence protein n=1 Tax=Carboxylicivirga caseinilyticus TaxID=3417572 RepID=UPI003D33B1E3|nr:ComEC/Rec2 family competence protein [Marinilabiliaceae bacterium A049]
MVKLFLSDSPFLRLVLPLITGIWLSGKTQLPSFYLTGISILLFILFAGFYYYYQLKPTFRLGFVAGLLMTICMLSFGATLHALRKPLFIDSNEMAVFKVQVISFVGETDINNKYEASIIDVSKDTLTSYIKESGIIYLSKNSQKQEIKAGTNLYISGQLLSFEPPTLPFQFDYSDYLKNNRVAFRMIVKDYQVLVDEGEFISLRLYLEKFKEYLNKRFIEYGLGQEELAILNAMFLGDKYQLSLEQKQAFTQAGAMHLLAVSGLHVGIIYLIVSWLFRLMIRNKVAVFICVFIMLWLYALLTGFSASVLRATIMFSVIEIGKFSQRRITIVNLLSASMFIILLIDPLFIYSIGFWLSHCAVASIVLFYPYVNRLVYFSFPPFRWFWSILALSVTAQLGAIPISLVTFHQFPVFFIFTNWLLIPVVTPVLVLALLSALLSPIGILLSVIVPALNDLLGFMNNITHLISNLPYSSITQIPFTWWQMLFFYSFLVVLIIRLEVQTLKSLRLLLLMAILFVICLHVNRFLVPDEGLIAVETEKGTFVNYFNPNVNEVYMVSELTDKDIDWFLSGVWQSYGIHSKPLYYKDCMEIDSLCIVKVIDGKSILIVRNGVEEEVDKVKMNFDFIVNLSPKDRIINNEDNGFKSIMLYEKPYLCFYEEKKYELKP